MFRRLLNRRELFWWARIFFGCGSQLGRTATVPNQIPALSFRLVRGGRRLTGLNAFSPWILSTHARARSVLRERRFAIKFSSCELKLDQSLNICDCMGS